MKRTRFILLGVVVVAVFLIVVSPSLRLVWSKGYVETNWEIVESAIIVDYSTEFGWDTSSRFYAAPLTQPYRISIIDRLNRQVCSIGSGRAFRTGHWIKTENQTVAYEMRDWNQYGLDISAQLDLSTWMVTITTRGTCALSWDNCHPVDPPAVVTYACTSS